MKLLLALLLLPLSVLANDKQQSVLNSFNQIEGKKVATALAYAPTQTIALTLTQYKMYVRPFYVLDLPNSASTICRDVTFTHRTNYSATSITACNLGGDWIFLFD